MKIYQAVGELCKGSTAHFDCVSLGSNPSSPTIIIFDRSIPQDVDIK
jgi:hypothetical protein